MATVGIAQLKAKLSEYLASVKRGEEVLITERGRPVARIVPVRPAMDDDARIQRLIARGAKPGRKWTPEELARFLARTPVCGVPEGALQRALREDRDSR